MGFGINHKGIRAKRVVTYGSEIKIIAFMESGVQLAGRIREVFLDGKWIANTNYNKVLSDVSFEGATRKLKDLNSIALLTFHVNYYVSGVLNVLRGGPLTIRDKYSFDMPTLAEEDNWAQLRSDLETNAMAIVQEVEKLSNEQLEKNFVKPEYGTFRRNLEGLIEHSYYHLGQISLLRKMLNSQTHD